MGIAFFDLDLTLLDTNSATLWIKRERRLGHISTGFFLKSAWYVGLYQLGRAKMEEVLEKAMLTVEGVEEALIQERTQAFWEEEVKMRFRPGAFAALEEHRAKGDACVLLSSTSPYMSVPTVAHLGLDGYLCSHFEVKDGRFTGRPDGPLCYGAGKLVHAQRYVEERGVSLADCAFYTDSYSDLPAMVAMGRPVAVHPDPRLKRHAEKAGWEIADWGVAEGSGRGARR